MNIVFVKHYSGKDYAFKVPDDMVEHIKKGDILVVETIRGITTGICQTDVISGSGALDIAIKHGAYTPLKPVIGKMYPELKKTIVNDLRQSIIGLFDQMTKMP